MMNIKIPFFKIRKIANLINLDFLTFRILTTTITNHISPTMPLAVLNSEIGLFPSVIAKPLRLRPPSNFAFILGPAFDIAIRVSLPTASMITFDFCASILLKVLSRLIFSS